MLKSSILDIKKEIAKRGFEIEHNSKNNTFKITDEYKVIILTFTDDEIVNWFNVESSLNRWNNKHPL